MDENRDYAKAVEVENIKENANTVLESINGLSPPDAMNALGVVASHLVVQYWEKELHFEVLDSWFSMVRDSVNKFGK